MGRGWCGCPTPMPGLGRGLVVLNYNHIRLVDLRWSVVIVVLVVVIKDKPQVTKAVGFTSMAHQPAWAPLFFWLLLGLWGLWLDLFFLPLFFMLFFLFHTSLFLVCQVFPQFSLPSPPLSLDQAPLLQLVLLVPQSLLLLLPQPLGFRVSG